MHYLPVLLYLARHGESEANILKIFANTPGKYGLTIRGQVQAEALAERLVPEGITRIYASPLLRAQETAQIIGRRLGLGFETSDSLREFSVGDHEGSCDKDAWDEYHQVETAWLVAGDTKARIGGGECFEDIEERFLPFVQFLIDTFGETEERILLLGHGGTFACMLPLVLSNIDRAFATTHGIQHTSVIKVEYREGDLVCLLWNDLPVPA